MRALLAVLLVATAPAMAQEDKVALKDGPGKDKVGQDEAFDIDGIDVATMRHHPLVPAALPIGEQRQQDAVIGEMAQAGHRPRRMLPQTMRIAPRRE